MTTDPRSEAVVRADTRRRVLAAFVTQGGPGDAQSGSRTRLLVAGVTAAVLLLVGGAVSGRLTPASGGWSDGDIVVARPSAARLVSVGGVLHPLLNTASGRLLSGPTGGRVTVVEDAAIVGARRGAPLGIPGAPDVLPRPTALVQTGWLACLDGNRVRTRITDPVARATADASTTAAPSGGQQAVVVSVDGHPGQIHLVVGDHRYQIPAASFPAVKQYLDQTSSPRPAAAGWVDLFPAGTELAFGSFTFAVPAAVGRPTGPGLGLRGTVTRIGQLVTNSDRSDAPFVIVGDGAVPLTSFAAAIYRGTAPAALGTPLAVTDADLALLPPSSNASFAPPDWPADAPLAGSGVPTSPASGSSGSSTPPPAGSEPSTAASATAASAVAASAMSPGASVPCAELDAATGRPPSTHLRFVPAWSASGSSPSTAPARAPSPGAGGEAEAPVLDPDGGAVVSVVTSPGSPGSPANETTVYLVDASGQAFPVAAPAPDTLARLGFAGVAPPVVPAGWIALCPPGPELGVAAAEAPGVGSGPS